MPLHKTNTSQQFNTIFHKDYKVILDAGDFSLAKVD